MAARDMMNFGLEVLCIMVCIMLMIHQLVMKNHRDTDKWFMSAIISNIGMMLGDLSAWILTESSWTYARTCYTAGMTFYYACSGVLLFSFFAYIYYYWESKINLSKIWVRVAQLMMLIQIVIAAISPFTGAVFYITEDVMYHRGSLFFLSQMTAVLTYFMALCIYIFAWKKKSMKNKEKICFFVYLITPFTAELIQILNYGLVLLNLSVTLSFLLVNLFINTEIDDQLRQSEQKLEQERMEALRKLEQSQKKLIDETIRALSNAVEAKDRYTNGHSQRVALYAREIVRRMGWSEEEQQKVYYAGLLHDVGKIRVQDALINKPGRLTQDEYDEIRLHALTGYHILKEISSISDFAIGARWHHERYDGKGYPNGLAGENIPVIARVISVADAYDAMTSNRSYRRIMPQEKVRQEIENGIGTQFDPAIAMIMLKMIDEDVTYSLSQPNGLSEKTVMAITDDEAVLKLLENVLQSRGMYRLLHEFSAEDGIERLKTESADLVLLDIATEGEEGLEILSWVRSQRSGMPVIVVTEDKDIRTLAKAEAIGISDYLTKPLNGLVLLESIENVLLNSRYMG